MAEEILKFSTNWNNKLFCPCFTSIRPSTRWQKGMTVTVTLNGDALYDAFIIDRRDYRKSQLSEFVARLDTGYSLDEMLEILHKMYPTSTATTPFGLLLLGRVKGSETHAYQRLMQRAAIVVLELPKAVAPYD